MARDVRDDAAPAPDLTGAGDGLRIAVVCGRFNSHVTMRLLDGVRRGLDRCGVRTDDVTEAWVPGAFEIPLVAKTFAATGRYDAVVGIGCVIRGDTAHFDFVAGQCASGIQQAALDTGVPIVFGVLTTEDLDQALARSEAAGGHNVGEESADTAVEVATLLTSIRDGDGGGGGEGPSSISDRVRSVVARVRHEVLDRSAPPAPSGPWDMYRERYRARPETFDAYVDVFTRVTGASDFPGGWTSFSKAANAEPAMDAALVARAEELMRLGGYESGPKAPGVGRRWRRVT